MSFLKKKTFFFLSIQDVVRYESLNHKLGILCVNKYLIASKPYNFTFGYYE